MLHYCHSRGVAHGSLRPEFITLSSDLWINLVGFHCASPVDSRPLALGGANSKGTALKSLVERWMARELTNLDYLLALNALAGRRVGDPNFHPVVPWVVEFNPDRTWRDLRRSKSRY
jgi:WD repeat-containing protein 81